LLQLWKKSWLICRTRLYQLLNNRQQDRHCSYQKFSGTIVATTLFVYDASRRLTTITAPHPGGQPDITTAPFGKGNLSSLSCGNSLV
jgi:hypothetical protein